MLHFTLESRIQRQINKSNDTLCNTSKTLSVLEKEIRFLLISIKKKTIVKKNSRMFYHEIKTNFGICIDKYELVKEWERKIYKDIESISDLKSKLIIKSRTYYLSKDRERVSKRILGVRSLLGMVPKSYKHEGGVSFLFVFVLFFLVALICYSGWYLYTKLGLNIMLPAKTH